MADKREWAMKTGLQSLVSSGMSQPALALWNSESDCDCDCETVAWRKKSFWYASLGGSYA
jgi:hypothetical protein